MHPNVHSSTIYNSEDMETTQVSINRWLAKKMWYIYTMEYYSAIKKDLQMQILPFAATWMDLENTVLSEVSQTEKYKYYMISLIYGI